MGHADACRARCGDAGALRLTATYTMKSRRHCTPATVFLSLMLGACAGTHVEADRGQDGSAQVSGSMAGQEVAANASSYTPFQKMEDTQIARDQGIYRDTQARIAELNAQRGVRLGSYALAKAQCWLDVSFHEYTRNDRGGFPRASLTQAQGILDQLEAGQNPDVSETPLVNDARRLRDDLWARHDRLRQDTEGMQCAAARLACAEVELVHAGNEIRQGGWRHASPYIQIAEDLTEEAEKLALQCKPKQVVATSVEKPAVPTPVIEAPAMPQLDVRFRFDRSGVVDILPEDRRKLMDFAEELKGKGPNEHQVLKLMGHTDRLGNRAYNERLSMRRAVTVRDELQRLGVRLPMEVRAMGATEDFSQGCHQAHAGAEKTVQCLQPDRRVSVELHSASTETVAEQ